MENGNNIFFGQTYTERTLIESILASHYILDYGFIKTVNADKTIDVTHAKQLKTLDGDSLPATVTKKVEVLTLAGGGFSLKFDYKKGDKVLLLGLKNYIPNVEDVTSATETTAYIHYSRETIKALPLCIFNDKADVTIAIEDGELELECKGKITIETKKDVEITAENVIANCSSFKVMPKGGGSAALEVTP
jgi:hypothetical protein